MEILINILQILFFYLTGFIVAIALVKVINTTITSNLQTPYYIGLKFVMMSWFFIIPFCILILFFLLAETINKILDLLSKSKLLKRFDEWIKYG